MKKLLTILFAAFISISFTTITHAQNGDKDIGIGVMVGEPTGLTLKSWINEENAFDVGLAWSLGRYDAVNIHADYLWHNYDVFDDVEEGSLPLYYGVGGRIVFSEDYPDPGDNNVVIGVRGPVGINYLFEESPLGLFLEIAPILNLTPETDLDLDGALGIRIYL